MGVSVYRGFRLLSELFTSHDSTRGPGQEVFQMPQVGSGRVESGQEVFKISRVGPGHHDPT